MDKDHGLGAALDTETVSSVAGIDIDQVLPVELGKATGADDEYCNVMMEDLPGFV